MRKYEAETMFSDAINNCLLQQQLDRAHNREKTVPGFDLSIAVDASVTQAF